MPSPNVGSPLSSVNAGLGSTDRIVSNLIGNDHFSVTLNSASGTTPVTILTGSPYYYLTRLAVKVDPTCTVAVAGIVTVTITDSSYGTLLQSRVYIPSTFTAPTVPTIASEDQAIGYYFNSRVNASTLTVSLNVALTAGSIRIAGNYGLTSNL